MFLFAAYMIIFIGVVVVSHSVLRLAADRAGQHEESYVVRTSQKLDEIYSRISAKRMYFLTIMSTLTVPMLLVALASNPFYALIGIPIGYLLPNLGLHFVRKRRLAKFDEQLVDAMDLVANAIRSGSSLPQALGIVVEEMPNPISEEFRTVTRQLALGQTLKDGLNGLNERMKSEELDLVVNSILIAQETGGDLAKMIKRISNTVRERNRIEGKIKSLTAQGKFQGIILGLMPFAMLVLIRVVDPEIMEPVFHSRMGAVLLSAVVVLDILGAWAIRRVMTIDV